jgi:predicted amidohydrolase
MQTLVLVLFAAVPDVFVHEAQLFGRHPFRQAGARFGAAVSVSAETLVVGSPFDDTPAGRNAGSAYVFVRSGTEWALQQKLLPSDGAADDFFGISVSISGDTVVIGARLDDTAAGEDAGSAYVFVRSGTTWTEQQKLLAPDGAAGDSFGTSVSVSGDAVVVGAPVADTPGGVDAGAAYVFVRSGTTWSEQAKLLAPDGAAGDDFAFSAAMSADTVVVGAPSDDTPVGEGSAHVFVRSGTAWTEQQEIAASDGGEDDAFGFSVSVFGDTLAVGAFADDTAAGRDAGSAYVFARTGTVWTEQQKLLPADEAAGDYFGYAVSVGEDTLVVGAPLHDPPAGLDAGSAYAFARSGATWTWQGTLGAPDAMAGDHLGNAVALFGDTTVAAASGDDTAGGKDAGSAHVFRGRVPVEEPSVTVE